MMLTYESSIFNSARLNTLWVNIDGVQGMIQGMMTACYNNGTNRLYFK